MSKTGDFYLEVVDALTKKLGREPTQDEIDAEAIRILEERQNEKN